MLLLNEWKWTVSVACVSLPYLLMAMFMSAYVSCDHCRTAAWTIFPAAPGVIFFALLRYLVDVRIDPLHPAGWLASVGIAFTLIGIVRLSLECYWWIAGLVCAAVAASSVFGAMALYSMIRA